MIYLNGKPVNTTLFPDNTSQVWKLNQEILETTNFAHIRWDFSHEGEFMQLAQLKSLLKRHGFKTCLRLSYLPYGRQDKEVDNNATFALRTFNNLLNFLDFDEIIIMDPHSNVTQQYVRFVRAEYPLKQLEAVISQTMTTLICYPDKGARDKYSKEYFSIVGHEYICGEKVRDQLTGKITDYKLFGNPKGQSVLIVDDICDGGATFIMLADELIANGAEEVNLFVSHGIFSKGLRPIFDSGIKRVFTKDGEAGEYQNQITYRRL